MGEAEPNTTHAQSLRTGVRIHVRFEQREACRMVAGKGTEQAGRKAAIRNDSAGRLWRENTKAQRRRDGCAKGAGECMARCWRVKDKPSCTLPRKARPRPHRLLVESRR